MKKIIMLLIFLLCIFCIYELCLNSKSELLYNENEVKNEFVKYLESKIQDTGSFQYLTNLDGTKEIDDYDILRHSLSYYALLKEYEKNDSKLDEKKQLIKRGIDYTLANLIYSGDNMAFVISSDAEEIILGDCALVTILMCEYQKVYQDNQYQEIIKKLANGILSMQRLEGRFNHVFWSEWQTLKSKDRIVYYEGEAVLALCKAYEATNETAFINCAYKAMDYYIESNYQEYKDHWQQYAIKEILKYDKKNKYQMYFYANLREKVLQIEETKKCYNTDLETLNCGISMPEMFQISGNSELYNQAEALYNNGISELVNVFNHFKSDKNKIEQFFEINGSNSIRIDEVAHYILAFES